MHRCRLTRHSTMRGEVPEASRVGVGGGEKRRFILVSITARGGCPMALILSTTVQLALHLQPTAAAEVISSRGGQGQRQSAEAISRGNQQSRAGGSGISRSMWLSRRRGRSALPACRIIQEAQEGSCDRGWQRRLGLPRGVRNRRVGHKQGQGREQGCEEEAPVEVVAFEEQPQLGGRAARLRAGGPRSQRRSNRRWATAQVVARSFYGGCRRWLRRPLGRRRKKHR
ncbi:uncharacterized protein [Triticum aestivum]|uniref:uncharacterized protein isoform X2 n=1 Tax=Triticum aestivum TaxID=4565 RepID=UPI001D0154BB|nr:uncharacterized protein LOC123093663 isoform X2 [Triticum aestivum]XP_044371609.1 uncharacterized protein LOC123093663 isoform X2 [Triticum aestivum]XP_044371610.1 uncharacterized protein LOC123093663 isoform X2 [Triticum aestivum]